VRALSKFALYPALTAALLCAAPSLLRAQSSGSSEPPGAPPPKPATKPNQDSAISSAPDQPKWDPLRAEKDLEVGAYYMKKGDVDAAIDRFNDAIEWKPGYALPFRYLAEAQEKKGRKRAALKSYKRYLDLYPRAEDAGKIRRKIDKLQNEIDKEENSAG
jgi:tetratricopeptide (TPR) repeat protein